MKRLNNFLNDLKTMGFVDFVNKYRLDFDELIIAVLMLYVVIDSGIMF